MSAIHTSIVGDAHAYTRSKVPWRLDTYRDVNARQNRFLVAAGAAAALWLVLLLW